MEIVKEVENAVIYTANTVGNIAQLIQQHPIITACFCLQFVRQGLYLLLCDEAGGMNAVNQELKFLFIKFSIYNSPSPCPPIILGFVAVFIQKEKVRAYRFLLYWDFIVVVKVFNDLLNLNRVGSIDVFSKIVQKVEQFEPLILRSTFTIFAVRHSVSYVADFLLV